MLTSAALSTEPCELLKSVVAPILVEIGDRWERGELRIAHEHACSTLMRGLLFSLMRLYPATDAQRRVVVGTPAKESHELGAMMVAMLAAMHGWSVFYFGPDLPAEEIAYAVNETDADLLMLSVTNLEAKAFQREITAIERSIPERVRILIGGRAATALPESRAQIEHNLVRVEAELSR
jgi:methanogenic corrinoid protein MtbC1